jgi:hypothetical protein
MALPFCLLAFAITRSGKPPDKAFMGVIYGAAPLGLLITQFGDSQDSHLMPVLIVCAWLAGIVAGHTLAAKLPRRRGDES